MHFFRTHVRLTVPPFDNPKMPLDVLKLNHTGACGARFVAVGWCCVLFFGVFCALFAAITMPFSAVFGDVCVVLPTLPIDLGKTLNVTGITQITDTCWDKNGNLFQGLELDNAIDTSSINFDEFDRLFGTSPTIDRSGMAALREALDQGVCDPGGTHMADVNSAYNNVDQNMTVAELGFQNSTAVKTLKREGRLLVEMLNNAMQKFIDSTGCYFVATTWNDVSNMLCGSMLGAISWWSASEMFLALVCLPWAVTTMFVSKRYGGHGPIAAPGAVYEPPSTETQDKAAGIDNGSAVVVQTYIAEGVLQPPGVEMGTMDGGQEKGAVKVPGDGTVPLPAEIIAIPANMEVAGTKVHAPPPASILDGTGAVAVEQGQLLGQLNASDYEPGPDTSNDAALAQALAGAGESAAAGGATTGAAAGTTVTVDTTGDGVADAVAVDTTGDGVPDTLLQDTTGDGQIDAATI